MIKVFFDDRCPICSREIDYYKRITPSADIVWCGISQHISTLEKNGISYIESLKVIHAINTENKHFRGVDVFILIWQQTSNWRWFAKIVKLPVIYHVSKALYSIFAHWRFNRLPLCKIGNKNDCLKL
ncbi:MAG: DUF393 domain-containing protein [Kordiimonadaceae bacterium]|jgi:predicted DCC family thiol-disulfide oxidoreductase YuxK|nr:DUF393 domain-containing protein [Kordiimonadaceae bacterium]MBT6032710.1 DUF393 domain-containing protein [Kordiimonadaceae bacterium]